MNEPPRQDDAPGGSLTAAAIVCYAVLLAAGAFWLWWRDRLGLVPEFAGGRHGVWMSAAAGAGVGLSLAGACALGARAVPALRDLERRLAGLIGPLTPRQAGIVALASGLGEEFLFRCAMQDALGWVWASLCFALAHAGPARLWLWPLLAGSVGLLFAAMVEWGLGLCSVTVAHALLNYLQLRRIAPA